jgi:hypothetical protein
VSSGFKPSVHEHRELAEANDVERRFVSRRAQRFGGEHDRKDEGEERHELLHHAESFLNVD